MFTCLHVCLNNIKVVHQTDQKKKVDSAKTRAKQYTPIWLVASFISTLLGGT